LSEDYVERSNLRIEPHRFMKELLRGQQRTVGRFDSRFLGIDVDGAGEHFDYDPSYAVVQGAYTAAVNSYLRTELKVDNNSTYEILTGKVQPWNYGPAKNRYLNVAPALRDAMTRNPELRLFVASGVYDLATPYFATDYTLDHLGLEKSLRKHITTASYDAGHMMYIRKADHARLRDDICRFLRATPTDPTKSE
jgi:carboxypeptidase C (cathepsin A)